MGEKGQCKVFWSKSNPNPWKDESACEEECESKSLFLANKPILYNLNFYNLIFINFSYNNHQTSGYNTPPKNYAQNLDNKETMDLENNEVII